MDHYYRRVAAGPEKRAGKFMIDAKNIKLVFINKIFFYCHEEVSKEVKA